MRKIMLDPERQTHRRFKDIIYHKQRKLLESYYILKANSLSDTTQEYMTQFIHSGALSDKAVDVLCILFSDIDPNLYDYPCKEKISCLRAIHKELFGSEQTDIPPFLNGRRTSFTPVKKVYNAAVQKNDIHIIGKESDISLSENYNL